jgi:hypothetical protein
MRYPGPQSAYLGELCFCYFVLGTNNDPEKVRILFTLVNVTGQLPGAFINHMKIDQIRPVVNLRRIFGASAARREGQELCIKHAMEMYREERSETFVHSRPHGLFRSNFRVVKINDIKLSQAFD